MAQGGYANKIRVHEQFTFPMPASIPSIAAAPMVSRLTGSHIGNREEALAMLKLAAEKILVR